MRRIAICAGALVVTLGPAIAKPIFAGWIRQTSGTVVLRDGGTDITLESRKAFGKRLFGGNKVRAMKSPASLLLFGRRFELTPAKGWYTIPSDPKKAPAGQDVYAKYILRAGRTRDSILYEKLWLALALQDLRNPDSSLKVELRVVNPKASYRTQDTVSLEARNGGPPAFVSVFDIDCEGTVAGIVRSVRLEAEGWKKLGTFRLDLPPGWKEGREVFKLIATDGETDFSSFDSDNRVRHEVVVEGAIDPLMYLLQITAGDKAGSNLGAWSTAETSVTIRR